MRRSACAAFVGAIIALATASGQADDFPGIEVLPVCADFSRPFELPTPTLPAERNLEIIVSVCRGKCDLIRLSW